ncbi:unnamed protein product [Leuciscus chuanchicus]
MERKFMKPGDDVLPIDKGLKNKWRWAWIEACASTFICGRDKTAYLERFGVAPYLKKELITRANKDAFIIMFDESMNTTTKTKQLDLHVRHWSTDETSTPIVRSRYLGSQFLGH